MQNPQEDEFPEGVELRDFDDFSTLRRNIFDKTKNALLSSFPLNYGKVRIELGDDLDYEGPEELPLSEQKKAILEDRYLARRLRGTVRMFDNETDELLDEKKLSLMRVPYLTERGTFIHGGNEYACFHKTVKVLTEKGYLPIGEIVNKKIQTRVWSYNFDKAKFELQPITGWWRNKKQAELGYSSFDSSGLESSKVGGRFVASTLWGTENHQVYTAQGEKVFLGDAKTLLAVEEKLSESQKQMILGTMLGDGHLTKSGAYRVAHCKAQEEYVKLKRDILISRNPNKIKRRITVTNKGEFETVWFDLKAAKETKILREEIYDSSGVRNLDSEWYTSINECGLAFWYADDGSVQYQRQTNCPIITLHTNNFLPEEVEKLRQWLEERWGLAFFVDDSKSKREGYSSKINRTLKISGPGAWSFLELVAPFLPKCMHYKLLPRPKTSSCKTCGKEVDPIREYCTDCLLEEVRNTKGKLNKTIRYRFGNSEKARLLAAANVSVPEETIATRWEVIMESAGTGIPSLLGDQDVIRELVEIPAQYHRDSGKNYSKAAVVYDIEVAGNHNYIANGVLVSNSIMQQRLLPGVYTRRQANGVLETQFNVNRGTGTGFRIWFEPETTQYRMRLGQANLHMYSLLKDLGVSDEELEKRWGKEILENNRAKYDARVFDKAYARLVPKREQNPEATREEKALAVREAFAKAQINKMVAEKNLPGMFDYSKSAEYKAKWAGRQEYIKKASQADEFVPDLTPADLQTEYQNLYGHRGTRLAGMNSWPKDWMPPGSNELGWLDWYFKHSNGTVTDDDERQKKRWKSFKARHLSQFLKNPTPRRAYALRMWAIDPIKYLPSEQRAEFKRVMEEYKDSRIKEAAALDQLRKAKDHSDKKQYSAKQRIVMGMMHQQPDEWVIDSEEETGYYGVTHTPTGFRLHVPRQVIPPNIKTDTSYALSPPGHTRKNPKAVIIKGNPLYIEGNEMADKFYNDLAGLLKEKGYDTSFDAGEPKTLPDETADIWVGHSRGQDRLQYAPAGVKTLAIDQFEDRVEEGRPTPGPEHYQITDALRNAISDLTSNRKAASFDEEELGLLAQFLNTEHGAGIPLTVSNEQMETAIINFLEGQGGNAAVLQAGIEGLEDVQKQAIEYAGDARKEIIGDKKALMLEKQASAMGIPDKENYGDLEGLSPGKLYNLLVQKHLAERVGAHRDIRIGDPDLGLLSWATRKPFENVEGGDRIQLFQQPLHSWDYKDFEGEISEGYGKGTVSKERDEQILLTHKRPGVISFSTTGKYPQRFNIIKTPDNKFLLQKGKVPEEHLASKAKYKDIHRDDLEDYLKNMKDSVAQAKIDGALAFLQMHGGKPEILSHRVSRKTGHPMLHTERVFGKVPHLDLPPHLRDAVVKGELYGEREGRSIPIQELGALLNSTLLNSLIKQKETGANLKLMPFDIVRAGGEDFSDVPYKQRLELLKELAGHMPEGKFEIPETAETPEEALDLLSRIKNKEHPLTEEGIVIHPETGVPLRSKLFDEQDVYIRGVFPGEPGSRLERKGLPGGFTYSFEPEGEIVGRVGTGLSDNLRGALADYVGRVARVQSHGRFQESGALRSPSLIAIHESK